MPFAQNLVYLAKTEAVYNVPESTFTGAILFREATWTPLESNNSERMAIRPWMGNNIRKPSMARSRLAGPVYLSGSGAAGTAPAWRHLMRACGMSETITASVKVEYAPVSAGFEGLSSLFYMDGLQQILSGGRGTFSIDLKAGDLPTISFDMQGLYHALATNSSPTVSFTPWIDPLPFSFDNTPSVTLFGVTVALSAFSYTHGNTIGYRDIVARQEIVISGRGPSASCTIEVPATLATDFIALAKSGTTGAFALQHGASAGNRIDISLPRVQILPDPKYVHQDNVVMVTLNLAPLPTAGDDEIKITVS